MMAPGTVLAPKEFRREVEKVRSQFIDEAPDQTERERRKRNTLNSMGIYERADYGRLADVRELIALRLAPWLTPHRPRR